MMLKYHFDYQCAKHEIIIGKYRLDITNLERETDDDHFGRILRTALDCLYNNSVFDKHPWIRNAMIETLYHIESLYDLGRERGLLCSLRHRLINNGVQYYIYRKIHTALLSDGKWVYAGMREGQLIFWNTEKEKIIHLLSQYVEYHAALNEKEISDEVCKNICDIKNIFPKDHSSRVWITQLKKTRLKQIEKQLMLWNKQDHRCMRDWGRQMYEWQNKKRITLEKM